MEKQQLGPHNAVVQSVGARVGASFKPRIVSTAQPRCIKEQRRIGYLCLTLLQKQMPKLCEEMSECFAILVFFCFFFTTTEIP